jgi:N-acetylneuraminate synthase/N,N'-diacetyllegionaminate synthase
MAETGKPIFVDTGSTTLGDIEKLIEAIYDEGNDRVILLHCSHSREDREINLHSVPFLSEVFKIPVGYSADSTDDLAEIIAVALGAKVIEKRLTLDRGYPGHHHIKALEPKEYQEYVRKIRRIENIMGEYGVRPSAEDLRQKALYYVSIVAEVDILEGTVIREGMLACKRPGSGIAPELMEMVVGRKARRNIARNELISWDAI